MPELGSLGSVRGALSNERPYRECESPIELMACLSYPRNSGPVRSIARSTSALRHDVAHGVPLALLIDENEGVDTVIFFVGEAIGCFHRREGARHIWMGRRKLLQLGRLGGIRRTCRHGEQHIPEVFSRRHREEFERVNHHVGFAAVGEMKFNGHSVWISLRGAIRQIGNTRRIRKAHNHRNGSAVEQHCLAETGGFRRGPGRATVRCTCTASPITASRPSSIATAARSSAWMRHERELIWIGSGNLTLFGQSSSTERPLSDAAIPSALKRRPICPMGTKFLQAM